MDIIAGGEYSPGGMEAEIGFGFRGSALPSGAYFLGLPLFFFIGIGIGCDVDGTDDAPAPWEIGEITPSPELSFSGLAEPGAASAIRGGEWKLRPTSATLVPIPVNGIASLLSIQHHMPDQRFSGRIKRSLPKSYGFSSLSHSTLRTGMSR